MLTILLIASYFMIGYGLGRLSNNLFRDDTPTEALPWYKRACRNLLFLFPYLIKGHGRAFSGWENRNKFQGENDEGAIRDFLASTGLNDGSHYYREMSEKDLKFYAQLSIYFWPVMHGIPVIFGLTRGIVLSVDSIVKSPFVLHERIENFFCDKNSTASPASSVDSIKDFANHTLGKYKENLEKSQKVCTSNIGGLKGSIERWRKIISDSKDKSLDTARYENIVSDLELQVKVQEKALSQNFTALKVISDKSSQLESLISILDEYKRTEELLARVKGKSFKTEMEDALEVARETEEVCRNAYDIESFSLMRQNNIPDEVVFNQIREGEAQASQIQQEIVSAHCTN